MEEKTENQDYVMGNPQNNPQNETDNSLVEHNEEANNGNPAVILEWICYIIGVIFVIIAFVEMSKDLDYNDNPFKFDEHRYVGGDAYNFIISAARSSAVMTKSLIWMVAGCSAFIIGRITALINKK